MYARCHYLHKSAKFHMAKAILAAFGEKQPLNSSREVLCGKVPLDFDSGYFLQDVRCGLGVV